MLYVVKGSCFLARVWGFCRLLVWVWQQIITIINREDDLGSLHQLWSGKLIKMEDRDNFHIFHELYSNIYHEFKFLPRHILGNKKSSHYRYVWSNISASLEDSHSKHTLKPVLITVCTLFGKLMQSNGYVRITTLLYFNFVNNKKWK